MPHQDRTGGSAGTLPADDVDSLVEFLRCRVADDRASLGDHLEQTGPQYQIGTMHQSTVLFAPGRVFAHLDAVEHTIEKYGDAMSWVRMAETNGQDTDLHRAAASAYLDSLRMHAAEWATHPDYRPSWRRS